MNKREALRLKLQDLFLAVRSSMSPHFTAALLSEIGVNTSRFDLVEETLSGGPYFRPMSQERLRSIDKRPNMCKIPFWEDRGRPSNSDAYMIQDAIVDQLDSLRDDDQCRN